MNKTTRALIVALTLLLTSNGYSQEDPLSTLATKRDFTSIAKSLTTYGKSVWEKEKLAYSKMKNPTFTINVNTIMNRPLRVLAGDNTPITNNSEEVKKQIQKNQDAANDAEGYFLKYKLNWNKYFLQDIIGVTSSIILPRTCPFDLSVVTSVKDQGPECGSCWAHSAAATWEHSHKKTFGTSGNTISHDLSEEDILNCGKNCDGVDCGSCATGGSVRKALEYIACTGTTKESAYPYTGRDRTCSTATSIVRDYGAFGWSQIGDNTNPPTIENIKAAITLYGAVASRVYVADGWFGYNYGVLNGIPSGSASILAPDSSSCPDCCNHVVTIVGWCDSRNAWIIKNSWGTGWGGYGGYAYVAYNTYNIGRYAYWIMPKPHN